eukprot:TRINITY_DN14356_c0_g1_i1.p1 TRINITY_DN14356_c0_g1~~TRINITY_DN14356_c0_g1_i1.p1  ORF type:complete len:147 (-),score=27.17 TRINITY_DN14356_c0_g1_i1:58-498(-)
MSDINNYLVCVDGSDSSLKAFRFALSLRKTNDKLIVMHINQVAKTSLLDPFHDNIDRAYTTDQAIMGKKLEKFYNDIISNEKLTNIDYVSLNSEDIKHEIITQSEKNRINTIVVADKGHSLLQNLLIGSTTTWLVRNSKIPVLVVK